MAAAVPATDERVAAALARNDRYLHEFVEALNLCPYAKPCRENGRLQRVVMFEAGGAPGSKGFDAAVDALDAAIAAIEQHPADSLDVALLLFPLLDPVLSHGLEGSRVFEQLVRVARERMQARHPHGDTPFYCVAFHPGFAEDLSDPDRAIRFIRRSPDPTVQLVRARVLRAVRGATPQGSRRVDVAGLDRAQLLALFTDATDTAPLTVSERITRANLRSLHQAGIERVRGLLEDIRCR